MTAQPTLHRLEQLSPRAFEHPADRAATAALKSVPGLDAVVRKLIEFGYERALRRGVLGSAVRLGEDQLGEVYRAHARAYATLDLEPVPDLYLTQFPIANALTIGAGRPIVVVNSELVQLLDAEQLRGVFAHEAGHVLSEHVLYRTALVILLRLSALPGVQCPVPDGAFYAFFDISAHFGRALGGKTVTDSAGFCQAALESAHVNLVPGSAFGAEGFVRLSFAASREQLSGGLDRLERLLRSEE